MRITIEDKCLKNNVLSVTSQNMGELRGFSDELLTGIELEIKVKPAKAKRSLNANAYAWELIYKLAAYMNLSATEVYREQVKEIGKYRTRLVLKSEYEEECREWTDGHTGRSIEQIGDCREYPEYVWVREWYGSSDFDTREMSRFLDLIIFECEQFGIQTESPQKLAEMKAAW